MPVLRWDPTAEPSVASDDDAETIVEDALSPAPNDWAKVLGEEAVNDVAGAVPAPAKPAPRPTTPSVVPAAKSPISALQDPLVPARSPIRISTSGPGKPSFLRPAIALGFVVMLGIVGVALFFRLRAVQPEPAPLDPIARPDPKAEPRPLEEATPPPKPEPQPQPKPQAQVRPGPSTKTAPKPIGLVTIISQPSGALVELDGGYIGKTPLVLRTKLDKPSYQLTLTAEGYVPWNRAVTVDLARQTLNVSAVLEPK
jgi:hypothetical protein